MAEAGFFSGKRVLVTGGAGFVGSHFVDALLAADAKVRVPLHVRPLAKPDPRIETVQADLTRIEDCRRAMQGVQQVIHAAGAVSAAAVTANAPASQMSAITENLALTARCLHAAWLEGVERILIFSSSTAYPPAQHAISEDEMWSGDPYPVYFGYGWMRRYIERLCEFAAAKSPLKIALIRPTAVYGRHDNFSSLTSHVVPGLIRRAVEKQDPFVVWGDGEDRRDFLHITDLVAGSLLALEKHAVCDPLNIGYGETISVRELVLLVLKAANHEGAKVEFDVAQPRAAPNRSVDISKARSLLGFSPRISLAEGILDTVSWYSEATHV